MKVSLLIVILTLSMAGLFIGCMPRPKALPIKEAAPSAAQESAGMMGSFNLQKRHGLGGWSKNAGPSEKQLLKQMTVPVDVEKETR